MTPTAARPVEPLAQPVPRALPAWVYNHPEMTRLEYERILRPSWQIVCHVSSLAAAGDYVTLELGADSVVAVRDAQGEIRAFHNVCRHRGARILEGSGTCPGAITCPYHGWSYRLSGELLAMPARETFPALDRTQLGLKPVRTQVMFGFVFVCLAGNPLPLQEIWAGVAAEFAPHRFEQMQPLGPMYIEHWECDWKIAMDNYLESYHVPIGHPGLNRMFTPDYDDQLNLPTGVARGSSWLREQPSSRWSERIYQKLIGQVATASARARAAPLELLQHAAESRHRRVSRPDGFLPGAAARPGELHHPWRLFALPDARREMRIVRYLSARINRQVQREDEFLCRRVQLGLQSGSYEPGPLSRLENCMLEFHDLLRERIPEVRLASAPARFA